MPNDNKNDDKKPETAGKPEAATKPGATARLSRRSLKPLDGTPSWGDAMSARQALKQVYATPSSTKEQKAAARRFYTARLRKSLREAGL